LGSACFAAARATHALRIVSSPLFSRPVIRPWRRDGEEAWFRGDTEDYGAAVLDLGLPGMDER
jgi:DNA-binding response OmpR family regulator